MKNVQTGARQHVDFNVVLKIYQKEELTIFFLEDASANRVVVIDASSCVHRVLLEINALHEVPFLLFLGKSGYGLVLSVKFAYKLNNFPLHLEFVFFGHVRQERHTSKVPLDH